MTGMYTQDTSLLGRWFVHTGCGYGLAPSGSKPLPERISFYDSIWCSFHLSVRKLIASYLHNRMKQCAKIQCKRSARSDAVGCCKRCATRFDIMTLTLKYIYQWRISPWYVLFYLQLCSWQLHFIFSKQYWLYKKCIEWWNQLTDDLVHFKFPADQRL